VILVRLPAFVLLSAFLASHPCTSGNPIHQDDEILTSFIYSN